MDIGNLSFVYKNPEKKHKKLPPQFTSVAGGVQKRIQSNLKYRKSCRLSVFDTVRNLSREASPQVAKEVDEIKLKQEQRKLQLEKWKAEKEKKKREEAARKKKPFVATIAHAPLSYIPLPPVKLMATTSKLMATTSKSTATTSKPTATTSKPTATTSKPTATTSKPTATTSKPTASTSGRVTRSQAAKAASAPKIAASFAPKNATFHPPKLQNPPTLNLQSKPKNKKKINLITFDPKPVVSERSVRPRSARQAAKELITDTKTKNDEASVYHKSNARGSIKPKPSPKKLKKTPKKMIPSSTESNTDQNSESISDNSVDLPINSKTVLIKTKRKSTRKSLLKVDVTPKNSVPKSESGSEEKLRSPRESTNTPERKAVPVKISPCVTMSRGKDNARREMKKKYEDGVLDEDCGDIESLDHFRRQLQGELARIAALCRTWDDVYQDCALPEIVKEQVLGAVGQARLLMGSKLQQFAGLIEKCAARDARAGLITPADLQGFWDMVFLQIENIDIRFKKLEELRAHNWCPPTPPPPSAVSTAPAPVGGKREERRVNRREGKTASSRLKDVIAAARKAKKEAASPLSVSHAPPASSDLTPTKTFEAGFFTVQSPVRSPAAAAAPANRTPVNKHMLLKSVLSSEAKKASASKNSSSSYAMLRASLLCKNVEIEGIEPLEQTPKSLPSIDLNATPARSILKSAKPSTKKSGKKSIKVVLFEKSDTEISPKQTVTQENCDSGMSSMDVDFDGKENVPRRPKLTRQDATDDTPVMTRSRRKSMQTPKEEEVRKTPKRSRQKVLQEVEIGEVIEKVATPKRTSRRKKSAPEIDINKNVTKQSSRRNKQAEDLIDFSSPHRVAALSPS